MSQHPYEHEGPVQDVGPTPEQKVAARRVQAREQGRGPVAQGRRPQDHRPTMSAYGLKPVAVEYEGHTYMVVPSVLDDWELIERQAEGTLEEMSLPDQYREMLGEDGYQELKENVRDKHGYVSARILGGFMQAVQEQLDGGNS